MKSISSQLLSFLQSGQSYYRADLMDLALANGQTIHAILAGPSAGRGNALAWNGNNYFGTDYGAWERGSVTSKADFSLEAHSMALSVVADTNVVIPGTSFELMSLVSDGFFDAATVNINTVYMPLGEWGVIEGSLKLFAGMIASVQRVGRSKAEFECYDWMYLLNLKVPLRVIQPSCFHTLFDHGCALTQSSYAIANTAAAGSTDTVIVPANNWPTTDPNSQDPQTPPYFAQGKIQFTSGNNNGLWSYVVSQGAAPNGSLTLLESTIFPVAAGDAFNAYPGCDKQASTCKGKFNNLIHFAGQPFTPPPETSA